MEFVVSPLLALILRKNSDKFSKHMIELRTRFMAFHAPLRTRSLRELPRVFTRLGGRPSGRAKARASRSIAGGTLHGFFLDESSLGHKVLWPFTLLCLGATALGGVLVGTSLLSPPATGHLIDFAGSLAYVGYMIVVLFIRRDFVVAIVGYLPSLIFLAVAFLVVYARVAQTALLIEFLGFELG